MDREAIKAPGGVGVGSAALQVGLPRRYLFRYF